MATYNVTRQALRQAGEVNTLLRTFIDVGWSLRTIESSAKFGPDEGILVTHSSGYKLTPVSPGARAVFSNYTRTLMDLQPNVPFDLRVMSFKSLERLLNALNIYSYVELNRSRAEPAIVQLSSRTKIADDSVFTMGFCLAALGATHIRLDDLYSEPLKLLSPP